MVILDWEHLLQHAAVLDAVQVKVLQARQFGEVGEPGFPNREFAGTDDRQAAQIHQRAKLCQASGGDSRHQGLEATVGHGDIDDVLVRLAGWGCQGR